MPRFAVLLHRTPQGYQRPTHFDLLLEADGTCRTWALASEPVAGEAVAAEALADHRLLYLEYEGDVAGERGTVTRYDHGQFEWLVNTSHQVQIVVRGQRLCGTVELMRSESEPLAWTCRFTPAVS